MDGLCDDVGKAAGIALALTDAAAVLLAAAVEAAASQAVAGTADANLRRTSVPPSATFKDDRGTAGASEGNCRGHDTQLVVSVARGLCCWCGHL